jgi:hypothetical protein
MKTKIIALLSLCFLFFHCARTPAPEQPQKLNGMALAQQEELRSDLLWEYILPMTQHKGIKQIGIFEVIPIYTEGRAVMVSSKEFPVGWQEKFTMSGEAAVSMSLWTPDEKNQVAVTFVKDLIPKLGNRTKITPALCGELGKSKFGFMFIVDKTEYSPSVNYADCNGLYGEIVTGKTAIEVRFQIIVASKLFRFQGKFAVQ